MELALELNGPSPFLSESEGRRCRPFLSSINTALVSIDYYCWRLTIIVCIVWRLTIIVCTIHLLTVCALGGLNGAVMHLRRFMLSTSCPLSSSVFLKYHFMALQGHSFLHLKACTITIWKCDGSSAFAKEVGRKVIFPFCTLQWTPIAKF